MPQNGTLRSWNDDRGFGFIAPTDGGGEVFVHISAFPLDRTRPTVGEKLSFELERGSEGKPRAIRVVRLAVGVSSGGKRRPPATARPRADANWLGRIVLLVIVVGVGSIGAYGYRQLAKSQQQTQARRALATQPATAADTSAPRVDGALRCDGRTTCSQMTSCAEAKWFINNCPGTKMDGNGDGVPCEQQWCSGWTSK